MKTIPRRVEPELLDTLPPDDPGAVASRRDLRWINAIARHAPVMARALGPMDGARILEIGAGDGAFLLSVARRVRGANVAFLLDRQAAVTETVRSGFRSVGWQSEVREVDAFEYLRGETPFDAVVANFFLHHFSDDELAELLRLVSGVTDRFVACEPRRSWVGLAGCRMLPLIGCHAVTRHDARVSVLAGFRDGEITRLWPDQNSWEIQERAFAPFGHLFKAVRRA